jgi:hypothetical protein
MKIAVSLAHIGNDKVDDRAVIRRPRISGGLFRLERLISVMLVDFKSFNV